MGLGRFIILQAANSRILRDSAPRYGFVRDAVARFMPGETAGKALEAAEALRASGISSVLTQLGENVRDPTEAAAVTQHYLKLLDIIEAQGPPATISVKPTQLGLDLDHKLCLENLTRIVSRAAGWLRGTPPIVWVDMESSTYVDRTLDVYREVRSIFPNVGVCLQAYLRRTPDDLESLLPYGPAIRLVKGAYREPPFIALAKKPSVDAMFFKLTQRLLSPEARGNGARAAIATHDLKLIRMICDYAASIGLAPADLEFQMLYGIQRTEQIRLAGTGVHSTALISYGNHWFPWFMRRLAERPANVGFLLRNLFR
jgi:proline dehydrogenase